jgi:hypothetical protein
VTAEQSASRGAAGSSPRDGPPWRSLRVCRSRRACLGSWRRVDHRVLGAVVDGAAAFRWSGDRPGALVPGEPEREESLQVDRGGTLRPSDAVGGDASVTDFAVPVADHPRD